MAGHFLYNLWARAFRREEWLKESKALTEPAFAPEAAIATALEKKKIESANMRKLTDKAYGHFLAWYENASAATLARINKNEEWRLFSTTTAEIESKRKTNACNVDVMHQLNTAYRSSVINLMRAFAKAYPDNKALIRTCSEVMLILGVPLSLPKSPAPPASDPQPSQG